MKRILRHADAVTAAQLKAQIDASRHPFQLFTLALCVFVGLPLILGDAKPGSISASLPLWAQDLWGYLLVLGGAIALASLRLKDRVSGLLLEQIGLVMAGCAALFYAAVALLTVGIGAAVASVFVVGFGVSCLARWVQLQQLLNTVRDALNPECDRCPNCRGRSCPSGNEDG